MSAPGSGQALDPATAGAIAGRFRATRWPPHRWHYFYALAKLRTDPLYPGVVDALRGTTAPLLDLGCGIGLLAHVLRAAGLRLPYRGVDNDVGKVAIARNAAALGGVGDALFEVGDLALGTPAHRGSVAILDVLQFVAPDAQDRLLDAAIGMLVPGARLVVRTGLDDGKRRARFTRGVDGLSRRVGWMNAGPGRYPDAAALAARFEAAGLEAAFEPLRGRTPFNNWRIVARLPQPGAQAGCAGASVAPDPASMSPGSTAR